MSYDMDFLLELMSEDLNGCWSKTEGWNLKQHKECIEKVRKEYYRRFPDKKDKIDEFLDSITVIIEAQMQ